MRIKLFLAFLLIALIALVILGTVVGTQTRSTLASFARSGGFAGADRLADHLADYYGTNGSWDGVADVLADGMQSGMTGSPGGMGHGGPQGQGQGAQQGTPQGSTGLMGLSMLGELTLTDAAGVVIFSESFEPDTLLSPNILESALPVVSQNQTVGYLIPDSRVIDLGEVVQAELSASINRSLLLTALLTGGLSLGLAILFAYVLMRPVRSLTDTVSAFAEDNLAVRSKIESRDEIGQLAGAFNQMASRLQHSQQLRQALTADIAHELRTPLAVQRANLEAIQDGIYPLTLENLGPVIHQNQLLSQLVEDLRTLALADENSLTLRLESCTLSSLIQQNVEAFRPNMEARQLTLETSLPADCPPLMADPQRISQVITNLLSNSLRHTPPGGQITVALTCNADQQQITVHDTGPGIAQEALPHIFERFYRADHSRDRQQGGTGLGLTIAQRLAQAHGGLITAANHSEGGAVFTVVLPIRRAD
jgi:signal transduction histidine kinase